MGHSPTTASMKTKFHIMGNMEQNNFSEENQLGLGSDFGVSRHMMDIFFMQSHTVKQILICKKSKPGRRCCARLD